MATRLGRQFEEVEQAMGEGSAFCKVMAMRLDRQIEQLESIVEQHLDVRGSLRPAGSSGSEGTGRHRHPGPRPLRYGLPCANCGLYYAAELVVCPICGCGERISPVVKPMRAVACYNVRPAPTNGLSAGECHAGSN